MAEAVSKLKSLGFRGCFTLPWCREADMERSDKPCFALSRNGVRFDTALYGHRPVCQVDLDVL
jgi:hypothetical protein